jgi:hypothetical protein
MSNLKDELANRGSKLCTQIAVNNTVDEINNKTRNISRKSRKHLLDDKIGLGEIQWLSPLTSDNYKEYQLNEIANKIPHHKLREVDWSFWPKNQPKWDAIGISPDDTLIMVEAKAHVNEFVSDKCRATKPHSRDIIEENIKDILGHNPVWMNKYYQTANRMVFVNKLHNLGIKVLLVYLCFVNDVSHIPEDKETVWDVKVNAMYKNHPIPDNLASLYKYVFVDLWRERGV